MWSYYGSKSKIIGYYPPPKYGKIIEPFAGTARYSLKYFDKEILLVDKNKDEISIWHYLQNATEKDILKLPKLKVGDDIRLFTWLCKEEILLLKHIGQAATANPGFITTEMGYRSSLTAYKNISSQLYKIKHWVIKEGCYKDIDNVEATWFIDPPYQFGGHKYKHSNKHIDYLELAEWCKSRNGQSIVCENTKSDWLPFTPFKKIQGGANTNTMEVMWSNFKTNYDNMQMGLF